MNELDYTSNIYDQHITSCYNTCVLYSHNEMTSSSGQHSLLIITK